MLLSVALSFALSFVSYIKSELSQVNQLRKHLRFI